MTRADQHPGAHLSGGSQLAFADGRQPFSRSEPATQLPRETVGRGRVRGRVPRPKVTVAGADIYRSPIPENRRHIHRHLAQVGSLTEIGQVYCLQRKIAPRRRDAHGSVHADARPETHAEYHSIAHRDAHAGPHSVARSWQPQSPWQLCVVA